MYPRDGLEILRNSKILNILLHPLQVFIDFSKLASLERRSTSRGLHPMEGFEVVRMLRGRDGMFW